MDLANDWTDHKLVFFMSKKHEPTKNKSFWTRGLNISEEDHQTSEHHSKNKKTNQLQFGMNVRETRERERAREKLLAAHL